MDSFTYTDLQVILKIDPTYCAGTLRVAFETSNEVVVVDTTEYNPHTGDVSVRLTQAQSAKLYGIVAVQVNGFLNGARWASEKCYFRCDNNLIRRALT